MKKQWLLLLIMFFFFLSLIYYFRTSEVKVTGTKAVPKITLTEILGRPVVPPGITPTPSSGISLSACAEQGKVLAALSLTDFGSQDNAPVGVIRLDKVWDLIDKIEQIQTKFPCEKKAKNSQMENALLQINKWCTLSKSLGAVKAAEQGEELDFPSAFSDTLVRSSPMDKCLGYYEMYRQDMAEELTKGVAISRISDLAILLNKFYSIGRKKPLDLDSLREISSRMRDVSPYNQEIVALSLQVEFSNWMQKNSGEEKSESSELEAALEKLEDLNSQDPFLSQYSLQYDFELGDFDAVRESANELIETNEGRNLGLYYLAQVYYQEENDAEMVKKLEEIVSGEYGDLKSEAYIALRRIKTEGTNSPGEFPLFPSPGVSLYHSFIFPVSDSNKDEMAGGGTVGFSLLPDVFTKIATSKYKKYLDESLVLPMKRFDEE